MNSVLHAARRVQWVRRICAGSRIPCGSVFETWLLKRFGSRIPCGSASLGRRLSMDSDAARRLQFGTSSRFGVVCHWIYMRLGVAWASSVNGFRCGSASPVCYLISLRHRPSLDLHAARRRLGVVCQWIQMRLGVAWALSVTEFRCGSAPLDGF